MTPEQINFIVKEVVAVCEAHADDGCFDADGALANSLRIVTSEKFLKLAALSPAKQEWVSVKERLPECDTWVLGYSARAFRFSRQMVVLFGQDAFFAKGFELHPDEVTHWKSLDEPALPYTEENPG